MDENTLIEGMARGDQRAFRELVERYKKKVYFLALDMAGNPVDAEDISQEVFLKVFRSFADVPEGGQARLLALPGDLQRVDRPSPEEGRGARARRGRRPRKPERDGGRGLPSRPAATRPRPRNRASSRTGSPGPWTRSRPRKRRSSSSAITTTSCSRTSPSRLGLSIGSVKSYLFRAVRKLQKELGRPALISGTETSHD